MLLFKGQGALDSSSPSPKGVLDRREVLHNLVKQVSNHRSVQIYPHWQLYCLPNYLWMVQCLR